MIYNFKTEGKSLEDFSDYQNPIHLFIHLRDGTVNPREVLKNQIRSRSISNFKSDLGDIKRGKSKSNNQISVIQNLHFLFFFYLREKINNILEIILLWYLKLNTKQNS